MTPDNLPPIPESPPVLFVLSSPSATGKDTIRDLLIAWQVPAHFAVTATTRPIRPGEVDGRDYHFIDVPSFERLIAEDALIEHAIVYGQHKGVPRAEVLEPLARGEDVIARVDVQGAATLRALIPDAVLIFIAPPSLAVAQERLERRATDSAEDQRLRIETAPSEMEAARDFDYVIVNETDHAEDAARRIVEIIAAEKAKRAK